MSKKRIAVLGIILEANVFAPVTRRVDFENYQLLQGEELRAVVGYLGLSDVGDWEIVPILVTAAESGGPLDHDDYLSFIDDIEQRLREAGPVDGVFIYGHGAGRTTALDDMDGDYFARVRAIVGPQIPIVAELDLHANLSDEMVAAADILVGYRTNPHVDQVARAKECAEHLQRLLLGEKATVAYQRLPLVTAQVAQLTAPDKPYGELMVYAEELMEREEVANVTLLSGFSFGDTPYNGFAICVTTWDDQDAATSLCDDLAQKAWGMRQRFVASPNTIADAVELEKAAAANGAAAPRVYADIADNPGGGGRGNTIHLLKAFAEAGIRNVMAGVYFDPALVERAVEAGEGATFDAVFNAEEQNALSGKWATPVRVDHLFEGQFVGKAEINEGMNVRLGPSAVLSVNDGEVKIVVCTLRHQVLSPEYFEVAGLDVRTANAVIVKSRGHFRAAFEPIADTSQVHEVDGPGLTTADISSIEWTSLPRPVYPIDPVEHWQTASVARSTVVAA